jgi:hypothetical protein
MGWVPVVADKLKLTACDTVYRVTFYTRLNLFEDLSIAKLVILAKHFTSDICYTSSMSGCTSRKISVIVVLIVVA